MPAARDNFIGFVSSKTRKLTSGKTFEAKSCVGFFTNPEGESLQDPQKSTRDDGAEVIRRKVPRRACSKQQAAGNDCTGKLRKLWVAKRGAKDEKQEDDDHDITSLRNVVFKREECKLEQDQGAVMGLQAAQCVTISEAGMTPFVLNRKNGWRERYAGVCESCFDQGKHCTHYPETRLKLLVLGTSTLGICSMACWDMYVQV